MNKKALKTLLGILIALAISLTLTVICVLFTPSIFKSTLNNGLEMLPKNKFVTYKVQSKSELAQEWFGDTYHYESDRLFFKQLQEKFPDSANKDSIFGHMRVIHEYPQPCLFTIVGKHITMDITWTIVGSRCRKEECNDPLFIENCPPPKGRRK